MRRLLQIAGIVPPGHPTHVELADRVDALEKALTRMGVRLREEELPEEARIDGGLCRLDGEVILYVSPNAPPWRRAEVLLDALRRLPHGSLWLPPEIRRLLEPERGGAGPTSLLGCSRRDER